MLRLVPIVEPSKPMVAQLALVKPSRSQSSKGMNREEGV